MRLAVLASRGAGDKVVVYDIVMWGQILSPASGHLGGRGANGETDL
jgi:hypothetical protein